jgi:glycosyltransferase involved in cell wall biosynthesis
MLFSVVIPTFNRAALLPRTLESVWAQGCTDFEAIVVDDGSSDGTKKWLASLGERVRVLHQRNRGPGAARNLALKETRGDYVAFLDSDDIWFPWTLATFAELIVKHGSPAILAAKMVEFWHDIDLDDVRSEPIRSEVFADYFAASRTGYFIGSGMSVLRRDVLLESGGFIVDRVSAEDHDLIVRLGAAPGFVQVIAPVTLGWRRHPNSETRNLAAVFAGVLRMIEQEHRDGYPGGSLRAPERREILTRHARSASLGCVRSGLVDQGWLLYCRTFHWNFRRKRWKYLAMFPLLAFLAKLHRRAKGFNDGQ